MIIDSMRRLEDSITESISPDFSPKNISRLAEEASEPLFLTDLVPFFQTDSQMAVSRNRFARKGSKYPFTDFLQHFEPNCRCQKPACNNNSFTSELVFGVTSLRKY